MITGGKPSIVTSSLQDRVTYFPYTRVSEKADHNLIILSGKQSR